MQVLIAIGSKATCIAVVRVLRTTNPLQSKLPYFSIPPDISPLISIEIEAPEAAPMAIGQKISAEDQNALSLNMNS